MESQKGVDNLTALTATAITVYREYANRLTRGAQMSTVATTKNKSVFDLLSEEQNGKRLVSWTLIEAAVIGEQACFTLHGLSRKWMAEQKRKAKTEALARPAAAAEGTAGA